MSMQPQTLRRALLLTAALGLVGLPALTFAQATTRLMVGFPAGGGTDAIARILAEPLQAELGIPVVVDNKAGAGGQIAAQALKMAAPDGHTLFLSHDHSVTILPMVMKNPGFDPAKDFVPVAGFATFVNHQFQGLCGLGAPAGRRQGCGGHTGAGIGAPVPGSGNREEKRT